MKAFIGLILLVSCGTLIRASENEEKVRSDVKQEKRSLSHGAIGGGYPTSSYQDFGGSYGSYGLAGGYGGAGIIGGPVYGGSGLIGGAPIITGSAPSIVSSGPLAVSGGPIVSGPGLVSTAAVTGVSTNTNTHTTYRQNVPVPVPVDRPFPV